MSSENGKSPLAGWSIVCQQGMVLIGQLQYGHERTLSPAYTFNVQIEGGIGWICTPLFMLTSIQGVAVSDGAVVIPCGSLSPKDQARVLRALRIGEEMSRKMRAADAGILTATEMPKGNKQ